MKEIITFNEWQDTGRFMERELFEENNPKENLHFDCTDIVYYLGGAYIQVLKTGDFFIDTKTSSKNLEDVEKALWERNPQLRCG